MKRYLLLLPLTLLATARCGASSGAAATKGPAADDAGLALDAGGDLASQEPDGATTWTAAEDAGAATSGDGCNGEVVGDSGSVDPPDPEGLDTNCDGADGIVGHDVYVSADVGADTNPGTPSAPLRTIAAGLTLAATTGGSVLVLHGTYPGTTFANAGVWAVYGGYPSGFVGQPNRQTTTLTAPDTGLLISEAGSATLAHLTVLGDMPSSLTQPSAHALRTSATKLSLVDVLLQAGDGLPMNPADAGAPGASGVSDEGPLYCNGVAQPGYTSGVCCGESSIDGKPPGSIAWSLRAQGTPGNAGTDGNDAKGAVSVSNGLLVGDTGQQGLANGTPGYGAATGGANTSATWVSPTGITPGSFSGGNGGSGGCPGSGGYGGSTGGASVALVVLAGAVTIQGSTLQAGLGGDGGDGGEGGSGGAGGQGTVPYFAGTLPSYFQNQPTCSTAPGAFNTDPLGVGCAEYGGIGGTGGAGGHGGGGAGGSTFGVVTVGSGTASMDSATTITLGEPGSGGVGNGGGRAPNGQRAATFHVN